MCIYGFVLLQCSFRSDYSSCTRTVSLVPAGSEKVTQTRPWFTPPGRLLKAAGSQSDFRPSSSCGLIEGADIPPGKGTGNSLRPRCAAESQRDPRKTPWKVTEKCLTPYLQYLVPHSECSLQLAPKGFMLFQRHSSERLVLCSRPLQSSGSGSEATCGGNAVRDACGEGEGARV